MSVVQPVYVRDVTEALDAVLKDKNTVGKTYGLAGPRTYTCAIPDVGRALQLQHCQC